MRKGKMLFGMVMVLLLMTVGKGYAVDIEFSGFGDVTYGFAFGDPADQQDDLLFKEFGTDANPVNIKEGFGNVGIDFVVLAELNDRLSFLSEVNFQLERGGTSDIGLDVERTYLDYRFSNAFNLQVGSFFTPIGFHNRVLYSRAWLMTSVQIPDFDEEELGLVPTHSTGVHVYGNFLLGGAHSLNYAVSVANGRGRDPVTLIIDRDIKKEKTVTALLEWVIPDYRDFRIGLSGWSAKLESFKVAPNTSGLPPSTTDITGPAAERIELRELGFNPFVILYTKPFNLILEYVVSQHEDDLGNLGGETFDFQALFAELSLNLMGGRLHPYIRYDFTELPDDGPQGLGGPYMPLRQDGDILTRHFIPEFEAIMVGVAYDLYAFNRIKVEYIQHLDGPRDEHGIVLQAAYGF